MTTAATIERVRFPGLSAEAFEHPLDHSALEALRRVPGLDLLLRKLASLHFERQIRIVYTASSLRITPRQMPELYALLEEACAILDVPEPEFYLMQAPYPNALTMGMERHTVVVTSSLLELLDRDELLGVIGHEVGHIKSGHMLYRTMAIFLGLIGAVAIRNLPFVNLLTEVLVYALYDWWRKSELTADRAGLLVMQDVDAALRLELKLAAGNQGKDRPLDIGEFLKQADDFDDMSTSLLDAFYMFEMTRFQTHPFPALRAREIKRWAETPEYRKLLLGDYPRREGAAADRLCPTCGANVTNATFRFCPECGASL